MAKKVTITQDPAKPVPVEVLAKDIRAIAQGFRALRKGPLRDSTLAMLINSAIPARDRPGTAAVHAVFDGIENLEATHLKKPAN